MSESLRVGGCCSAMGDYCIYHGTKRREETSMPNPTPNPSSPEEIAKEIVGYNCECDYALEQSAQQNIKFKPCRVCRVATAIAQERERHKKQIEDLSYTFVEKVEEIDAVRKDLESKLAELVNKTYDRTEVDKLVKHLKAQLAHKERELVESEANNEAIKKMYLLEKEASDRLRAELEAERDSYYRQLVDLAVELDKLKGAK